ncbi:MAG: dihydropteroate synthase-like protein [Promethearchaeota archaeon]
MKSIKEYKITIEKAPVSISAFLSEEITENILKKISILQYNLILLPGFVQWDTTNLEKKFSVIIRKGPEFASDLPIILNNLDQIKLSNKIPANKLFEISGEKEYERIVKEQLECAKNNLGHHTFYINEQRSDLIIGRNLPPPIIAEIVNCTEKADSSIIKKAKYYINSGADVIDIGCVSNKPNPERVKKLIKLLRDNFNILVSIDSMESEEILAAVDENIDLILSFDLGNYKEFLNIPKDIPIVILPTNVKEGYFPRDPEIRVNNLFQITKELHSYGFKKLIADPLLETPIAPGICNSLETYFLYKNKIALANYQSMELPLFFGISNVVELMDIDSIGINGLLASIAIELDTGILFTVEHSTKLTGGVKELKESVKLNYISKYKKSPPINQGIQVFRVKGKLSQKIAEINENDAIIVDKFDPDYIPDQKGYFKFYVDHHAGKIYLLHFSNDHNLLTTLIGTNAEAISKKAIEMNLTRNLQHANYLGRELSKAEFCLFSGRPYIQDVLLKKKEF